MFDTLSLSLSIATFKFESVCQQSELAEYHQRQRLCQKSKYSGMKSVPPRGSGWVRSPSVWISLRKCMPEESFGFAPTRYREVVLTPSRRALSFDTVSAVGGLFKSSLRVAILISLTRRE
jgi:hypothetical protein